MRQFLLSILCLLVISGCAENKNLSPSQYDAELHKAVLKSWYDIVDGMDRYQITRGKVVVRFCLWSDGRISGVKIIENTSGVPEALAVQRAVLNHASYKPWPEGMAQQIGSNYRWMRYTFEYGKYSMF